VSTRRVLALVIAVAGLFAVAALASHGRPLSTSHGGGPTPRFFDYVFTTFVLVGIAIGALVLVAMLRTRPERPRPAPRKWNLLGAMLSLAAAFGLAFVLSHSSFEHRMQKILQQHDVVPRKQRAQPTPQRSNPSGRSGSLRWDEIAIVAALLAAAGVAAFASRASKPAKPWRLRPQEEVALALDESLDDLRSEPDLRRAIIAAYARMERTLAATGVPRRPSETPLEYLERALQALDASAPAVTRLTDLFEWAKFSQHEPDESMRDDAIDALVALRDELREPVGAAA
jgi:hypothetical protein